MAIAIIQLMTRIAISLSILVLGLGCVSTQQVTDPVDPELQEQSSPSVSKIDLSQTWGEVGRPFYADVQLVDNIRDREYSVSRLPPGLRFDEKKQIISGVPQQTGFYTVHVAVRRKIEDRPFRYTRPSDRWFSEDFELRIYNRLTD